MRPITLANRQMCPANGARRDRRARLRVHSNRLAPGSPVVRGSDVKDVRITVVPLKIDQVNLPARINTRLRLNAISRTSQWRNLWRLTRRQYRKERGHRQNE